ncbi:hypothetical protein LZ31DRAFT_150010 [Colletotrichum somersetense]|nr:hypothetical protein LZ31DRAFT_150010 [Colletotrichum somersetense]
MLCTTYLRVHVGPWTLSCASYLPISAFARQQTRSRPCSLLLFCGYRAPRTGPSDHHELMVYIHYLDVHAGAVMLRSRFAGKLIDAHIALCPKHRIRVAARLRPTLLGRWVEDSRSPSSRSLTQPPTPQVRIASLCVHDSVSMVVQPNRVTWHPSWMRGTDEQCTDTSVCTDLPLCPQFHLPSVGRKRPCSRPDQTASTGPL